MLKAATDAVGETTVERADAAVVEAQEAEEMAMTKEAELAAKAAEAREKMRRAVAAKAEAAAVLALKVEALEGVGDKEKESTLKLEAAESACNDLEAKVMVLGLAMIEARGALHADSAADGAASAAANQEARRQSAARDMRAVAMATAKGADGKPISETLSTVDKWRLFRQWQAEGGLGADMWNIRRLFYQMDGSLLDSVPLMVSDVVGSALERSPASPSHCRLSGDGLSRAAVGQVASFTIHSCSDKGIFYDTGGDTFSVAIRFVGQAIAVRAKVFDNDDGTYSVTFKPTSTGKCSIAISLITPSPTPGKDKVEPLPGSPFICVVSGSMPCAAQCRVRGDALSRVIAQSPASFYVAFRDALGQVSHATELDVWVQPYASGAPSAIDYGDAFLSQEGRASPTGARDTSTFASSSSASPPPLIDLSTGDASGGPAGDDTSSSSSPAAIEPIDTASAAAASTTAIIATPTSASTASAASAARRASSGSASANSDGGGRSLSEGIISMFLAPRGAFESFVVGPRPLDVSRTVERGSEAIGRMQPGRTLKILRIEPVTADGVLRACVMLELEDIEPKEGVEWRRVYPQEQEWRTLSWRARVLEAQREEEDAAKAAQLRIEQRLNTAASKVQGGWRCKEARNRTGRMRQEKVARAEAEAEAEAARKAAEAEEEQQKKQADAKQKKDKADAKNAREGKRGAGKGTGSPAKGGKAGGGGGGAGAKPSKATRALSPAELSPRSKNRLFSHGLLKIHLKSASGLLSADANGLSDPYVVLTAGSNPKQEKKSKVINETLAPVWNEKYTLKGKLADFMATGVYLKLFDSDDADRATVDRMAKDDPIGDITLKLDPLKKGDSFEADAAPLSTQGVISVAISWVNKEEQDSASLLQFKMSGLMARKRYLRDLHARKPEYFEERGLEPPGPPAGGDPAVAASYPQGKIPPGALTGAPAARAPAAGAPAGAPAGSRLGSRASRPAGSPATAGSLRSPSPTAARTGAPSSSAAAAGRKTLRGLGDAGDGVSTKRVGKPSTPPGAAGRRAKAKSPDGKHLKSNRGAKPAGAGGGAGTGTASTIGSPSTVHGPAELGAGAGGGRAASPRSKRTARSSALGGNGVVGGGLGGEGVVGARTVGLGTRLTLGGSGVGRQMQAAGTGELYGWITLAAGTEAYVSKQRGRLPAHVRQQHLQQWHKQQRIDSDRERERAALHDREIDAARALEAAREERAMLSMQQQHNSSSGSLSGFVGGRGSPRAPTGIPHDHKGAEGLPVRPAYLEMKEADPKRIGFAYGGVYPGRLHAKGQLIDEHEVSFSIGTRGTYLLHVRLREPHVGDAGVGYVGGGGLISGGEDAWEIPGSPFLLHVAPGSAYPLATQIPPHELPLKGGPNVTQGALPKGMASAGAVDRYSCTLLLVSRDKMGNACDTGGGSVSCGYIEPREPARTSRASADGDLTSPSHSHSTSQARGGAGVPASPSGKTASSSSGRATASTRPSPSVPNGFYPSPGGDAATPSSTAAGAGHQALRSPLQQHARGAAYVDKGDGTYLIRWYSEVPGAFNVFVKMDGLHVLGSPCRMILAPPAPPTPSKGGSAGGGINAVAGAVDPGAKSKRTARESARDAKKLESGEAASPAKATKAQAPSPADKPAAGAPSPSGDPQQRRSSRESGEAA